MKVKVLMTLCLIGTIGTSQAMMRSAVTKLTSVRAAAAQVLSQKSLERLAPLHARRPILDRFSLRGIAAMLALETALIMYLKDFEINTHYLPRPTSFDPITSEIRREPIPGQDPDGRVFDYVCGLLLEGKRNCQTLDRYMEEHFDDLETDLLYKILKKFDHHWFLRYEPLKQKWVKRTLEKYFGVAQDISSSFFFSDIFAMADSATRRWWFAKHPDNHSNTYSTSVSQPIPISQPTFPVDNDSRFTPDKETLFITKSSLLVEILKTQSPEEKRKASEVLAKAFGWSSGVSGYDNHIWVHAQIITAQGPMIAGVAIYYRQDANNIYVCYLGIDPQHQKKGIGEAILNYIATVTDCDALHLTALSSARDFYMNKVGFSSTCGECSSLFKEFKKSKPKIFSTL